MKILLIEDDLFFQKFYSTKLAEVGYEIETASDGNEGLAKMTDVASRPNLVLLDMIMPHKDGFEVLEAVSKNDELKKIPIIIFSTLGDEEDVKRAVSLGAVDYINKSLHDIENLKQKISSHLPGGSIPTPVAVSNSTNLSSSQPVPQVVQPSQQTQPPAQQPQPQVTNPPISSPSNSNGNTTGTT